MERKWPIETAEAWDNVGLLIGKRSAKVSNVLCALDVTDAVIEQAIEVRAQMIVAHHSLIHGNGVTKINDDTRLGKAILNLAENGIALYVAHTNLDSGLGGTNDCLAIKLALTNIAPLVLGDGDKPFTGRMGRLETPMPISDFAGYAAKILALPAVNYVGSGMVSNVAVCSGGGAASGFLKRAVAAGCDTYVTGDVKYHTAHEAAEMGLNIIDATHFGTEIFVAEAVCNYLAKELKINVTIANEKNIFKVWKGQTNEN